jgi:hypothetical protein
VFLSIGRSHGPFRQEQGRRKKMGGAKEDREELPRRELDRPIGRASVAL